MKKFSIDLVYKKLNREVKTYKVPVIELIEAQTKDPFKILVATILSARTKDEVTTQASKRLFTKANNLKELEQIKISELEKIIYPVGFYKTKARNLKKLPITIKTEFGSKIPETVEELILLPGVGRKTANLVVAVAFKKDAICVDTHVHRIMNRFGYVKTKTPLETEMTLRKKLPKEYWQTINTILVAYGQKTCLPTSPWCSKCPVEEYCPKIGVKRNR